MTEITPANISERLGPKSKPLLVFGVGPVLDSNTRHRAGDVNAIPGQEDVPFISHNLAQAVSILYEAGAAGTIIVMGGKTGGPEYGSESTLIGQAMQKLGIPGGKILLEEESYDTPTNFVNFLNLYTSPNSPITEPQVSLLGADWHLSRLRLFAKMFAIPVKNVFSAEEVLRFKARAPQGNLATEDSTQWNTKQLQMIEDMLDMNDPEKFYAKKQGAERKNSYERRLHDSLWIREALQFPERMLHIMAGIKNDIRLKEMVKIAFKLYTAEEMAPFNLGLDDNPDILRSKLKTITWPIHSVEEKEQLVKQWERESVENQGLPNHLMRKLVFLMNYDPKVE